LRLLVGVFENKNLKEEEEAGSRSGSSTCPDHLEQISIKSRTTSLILWPTSQLNLRLLVVFENKNLKEEEEEGSRSGSSTCPDHLEQISLKTFLGCEFEGFSPSSRFGAYAS
jgi:hypothetical protein